MILIIIRIVNNILKKNKISNKLLEWLTKYKQFKLFID